MVGMLTVMLCAAAEPIFFQSHRGGMDEVPENTLEAVVYSWNIPGAIPEVDIRTTHDGVIICLHDETLGRTVEAPRALRSKPVTELRWEDIRWCDAGIRFGRAYAGIRIPTLEDVFERMKEEPARKLWLDIKDVDMDALEALIEEHGVGGQLLYVHGDIEGCRELRKRFPSAEVMTWCSGTPEQIRARYEAIRDDNFAPVTMLQFHLATEKNAEGQQVPVLSDAFLREAIAEMKAAGVKPQLRPVVLDDPKLWEYCLLDLGVRWYVADAPNAFVTAVANAMKAHHAGQSSAPASPAR